MDKPLLDEIIACLPRGRTLFHYHRDRFALYLLERKFRQGQLYTLADLKHSPYKAWLNRPLIRQWQAAQGRADTPLAGLFGLGAAQQSEPYLLSLGQWGSTNPRDSLQTSRPGYNLVLHLNLPLQHERWINALGVPSSKEWRGSSHPNADSRITLAWARIDLDLATGQALIEEIQSDWVRTLPKLFARARRSLQQGQPDIWCYRRQVSAQKLLSYERYLLHHAEIWSEAMLTAALWFLQEEIGVSEIFYHSWQTGVTIKQMDPTWAPPRSLYSELPERFCFSRRSHGPEFLENHHRVLKVKKKAAQWNWYHWAA